MKLVSQTLTFVCAKISPDKHVQGISAIIMVALTLLLLGDVSALLIKLNTVEPPSMNYLVCCAIWGLRFIITLALIIGFIDFAYEPTDVDPNHEERS